MFRQRLASSQSSWVSTAVAVGEVKGPRKPERRQTRQQRGVEPLQNEFTN